MNRIEFIESLNRFASLLFFTFFFFLLHAVYKFGAAYNFDILNHLTLNKIIVLVIATTLTIFSLVWGSCCVIYRKRNIITNINLAIISTIIISPILGETFLRIGITVNIPFFRNPELYSDAYSDDDYWKLYAIWDITSNWNNDPLLGWSIPKTSENPLGIHKEKEYVPNFQGKVILFFGDSFVAAQTGTQSLPSILDSLLPFYDVYNYGINGYGVDQIYLRFQQEHQQFSDPIVLFGVLTMDLDRSVLKIRSTVKPCFILQKEHLVLTNVPIPLTSVKAWVQDHPPQIRSYYFSVVLRFIDLIMANFDDKRVNHRKDEKELINQHIFKKIQEETEINHSALTCILFYSPLEMYTTGWRERFLRETLEQLDIPYIDTKELIIRDAMEKGKEVVYTAESINHRLLELS